MESAVIRDRVREIAAVAAEKWGTEFVHSEIAGSKRNMTLRVFIDKPGGVTLDDCSNVSRAIEAVLDEGDLIPAAYTLEVSSPGLDRGLYSLKDFERFAGKKAKIKIGGEIGGQSNFNGRIAGVRGEEIDFEDRTSGPVSIPFDKIEKANLKFDMQEELKKR